MITADHPDATSETFDALRVRVYLQRFSAASLDLLIDVARVMAPKADRFALWIRSVVECERWRRDVTEIPVESLRPLLDVRDWTGAQVAQATNALRTLDIADAPDVTAFLAGCLDVLLAAALARIQCREFQRHA